MIKEAEDKGISVLVVEGDEDVFHFVKKSLAENKTFIPKVEHALDVEQALKKLKQRRYHLILAESELQDKEGLELLSNMQAQKMELPFVLMTQTRDEVFNQKAMKRGVSDLIVKSESNYNELSSRLKDCYEKFYENKKGLKEFRERVRKGILESPQEDSSPASARDELTGLYNHSHLHDRIVREFEAATRQNYPLSFLLLDIDNFKSLNEEYGYGVGEEVLKEVGSLLFRHCRLSDYIARYGGEEFGVILSHIEYEGSLEMAKRLKQVFSKHVFLAETHAIHLTVSIGVSCYPKDPIKRRAELITFAHQALFRSKASGRNAITLYKDLLPTFGEGLPAIQIREDKVMEFQRRMTQIANTARRSYMEASQALIQALEAKDPFTAGHSGSCGKYAARTANKMGMGPEEAEIVQHAAVLHDVGKICISDSVLLKPGRLNFVEYEAMKQHPYLGYKILKPIKFLQEEAMMVLHHHEWYNGEGYPCRLKGNEIPIGSRIVSVIDSYDTMRIAGGRYKKTFTVTDAVNELITCSGTQFDPHVVKAFIEVLKELKELVSDDYQSERLAELCNAHPQS